MDKDIFRQKSISRMQSPDNLKEYIKVISPGLWIVFIAVLLLIIGAFVWATAGKIEDRAAFTAVVQNGEVTCGYLDSVQTGMNAVVDGHSGKVSNVTSSGVSILLEEKLSDGVYAGYVVLGEISPISFVFN